MVLPVIGVEFPEGAAPAAVAVLLDACDQAFVDGDCGELGRDDDEGIEYELTATIVWLNDTEARVSVARKKDGNFDSEDVSFVSQDESLERYRTLGFAIGTLGSGFVTEPATEPVPEEPVPLLKAPEPEARTPPEDPPDAIPDAAFESPNEPLPPELTQFQLEAGALGGNGLGNVRFGGELGLWAPVYRRWVSQWSFGYATQARTSDGTGAYFLLANASVGPRFMIDRTLVSATMGVQAEQMEATLGEAEVGRKKPAVGPLISIYARLLRDTVAPFVSVRVSYLPKTPVLVQGVDPTGVAIPGTQRQLGQHGPWQLEASAGVSFAFAP